MGKTKITVRGYVILIAENCPTVADGRVFFSENKAREYRKTLPFGETAYYSIDSVEIPLSPLMRVCRRRRKRK